MRQRFCSAYRTAVALMRVVTTVFVVAAATPGRAAGVQVMDGDTLILDGITYRLEGIEAPQTDQTCLDDKGAVWRCGIEARDRLRDYVGQRDVRCTDRGQDGVYGKRRIGECSVASESISMNQWMVQEGWALDVGRAAKARFKSDRESVDPSRAIPAKVSFVSPEALRRFTISTTSLLGAACPPASNWKTRQMLFPDSPAMPPDCPIKGRINLRSQVTGYQGIYHLPGCRSYERTRTPNRWFCSEQEALAEGYRKSFTC